MFFFQTRHLRLNFGLMPCAMTSTKHVRFATDNMNSSIREISRCIIRMSFDQTIKFNAFRLLDWLLEHNIQKDSKTPSGYTYDGLLYDNEDDSDPYFHFFNDKYDGLSFSVVPSKTNYEYYIESNGVRSLNGFTLIKMFIRDKMQ